MKNILSTTQIDAIHSWCKSHYIENYNINSNGEIDVDGKVMLYGSKLTLLPFKFNEVTGIFDVSRNKLTNLHNSPNVVGEFICSSNQLTTLEGCPKLIHHDLDFSDNHIESTYVGDYDVIINGEVFLKENRIDSDFTDPFTIDMRHDEFAFEDDYNSEIIKLIFKYQRHFEIWNTDGSLNEENYNELIEEIKDGLE